MGANGKGGLFEGNEIDHNLTAGFNWGWEGGGSKFAGTDSLIVRNNYVHHNYGPGLWTDINNRYTLYEGNRVEYNASMGIFHEISYDAVIRCNTVRHNAINDYPWLYGAQILVSTSQNVEVLNNVVAVNAAGGNGICVINQNRDGGVNWYGRSNYVHDNVITYLGAPGTSGAAADWDRANFWATGNNRFDHNTYHAPDLAAKHWSWRKAQDTTGTSLDWNGFRTQGGQEAHGSADTDLSAATSVAQCSTTSTAYPGRGRQGYRTTGSNGNRTAGAERGDAVWYSINGQRLAGVRQVRAGQVVIVVRDGLVRRVVRESGPE